MYHIILTDNAIAIDNVWSFDTVDEDRAAIELAAELLAEVPTCNGADVRDMGHDDRDVLIAVLSREGLDTDSHYIASNAIRTALRGTRVA